MHPIHILPEPKYIRPVFESFDPLVRTNRSRYCHYLIPILSLSHSSFSWFLYTQSWQHLIYVCVCLYIYMCVCRHIDAHTCCMQLCIDTLRHYLMVYEHIKCHSYRTWWCGTFKLETIDIFESRVLNNH